MPPENGEFIKLTEDEIFERLEQNLKNELGASAQPGNLVTKQLRAEAKTLAQNQEEALKRVYEAAYLDSAEGKELDKTVDLIGLSRRSPNSASGTVRFSRDSPPSQDYVIPRGTTVQTSNPDIYEFNTTEKSVLSYIDGFEGTELTGWEGDTGSVSIVSTNNLTDSQALELPATAGVGINTVDTYKVGSVLELDLYPNGDTVTGIRAGYQDDNNFYEVVVNVNSNSFELREVKGGTEQRNQSENVTLNASDAVHVTFDWALYGDLRATLYQSNSKDTKMAELFMDVNDPVNWNEGDFALESKDGTATTLVDEVSVSAKTVNVEADSAGVDTNVARNAITIISDSLAGVEEVVNEVPTGDPEYVDTDLAEFTIGRNEETDEQLRKRALNNSAIGGAATATAIGTKVSELDTVQSVKTFTNKTASTVDGMEPHSFEVVVHGGDTENVAKAIFESKAVDSQDIGGAHGTEQTYTVTSDVLAENETIHWSSPAEISLDITLDLIVDDTYVGDDEIKSLTVEYVGGTDVDGSFVPGVEPGADIYAAVLKQRLVNPSETGVWEVDNLKFDKNDDGTDDTTTTANGAEVLSVGAGEVGKANARDDSITINTVTK